MKDNSIILEILHGEEIPNILIPFLILFLGIKKGDIYNAETLNKKLGKQNLPRKVVISAAFTRMMDIYFLG